MSRTATVTLIALTFLSSACRDLGLAGNVPEGESRMAAPPELVSQVVAPVPGTATQLVMDGRLWVPTGRPMPRDAEQLRPVGATAGQTVYARAWDERPYRAIFVQVPATPPGVEPTPRQTMDAGLDHWQEYAPVPGRGARPQAPTHLVPEAAGGAPRTTQPNDTIQ
jgi:hypothetical protein